MSMIVLTRILSVIKITIFLETPIESASSNANVSRLILSVPFRIHGELNQVKFRLMKVDLL
jgi:hypothetical protein